MKQAFCVIFAFFVSTIIIPQEICAGVTSCTARDFVIEKSRESPTPTKVKNVAADIKNDFNINEIDYFFEKLICPNYNFNEPKESSSTSIISDTEIKKIEKYIPLQNYKKSTSRVYKTKFRKFDSNDKLVSTETLSPSNLIPLTYTIRFQNTGSDTVLFVSILDTLSPLLKLETIRDFSSSHPATFTILPGRVLQANFDNILLPDSNVNEKKSHGSFSFTINPMSNLVINQKIENKAAIYFDFNSPIITNKVRTTVMVTQVKGEMSTKPLLIPNPTTGSLKFAWSKQPKGRLVAVNAAGMSKGIAYTYSEGQVYANLQECSTGIYMLRFENGATIGKVSLEK